MKRTTPPIPQLWQDLDVSCDLPPYLRGLGITHALGRPDRSGRVTFTRVVGVSPIGMWEWHPLSGHLSHPRLLKRGVIDYLFAVSTNNSVNTDASEI